MSKYKYVIFDLDGTIADTLEDLANSTNKALAYFGYAPQPIEKFKYFVGNGAKMMVERAMPQDSSQDVLDKALKIFIEDYAVNYINTTKTYAGLPEVLNELKNSGIKMSVVTNKPDYRAYEIVNKLYGDIFVRVAGHTDRFPLKPDPTLTFDVMKTMGCTSQNTVFVGDSGVDMKTALNANLDSIGVLWGFREENELKENGARFLARTPKDLLKIIL